jgi:hypothetical protein
MTEHGVALTLARYTARKAVKQRLWDRGIKLQSVSARDVILAAEATSSSTPSC